MAWTLGYRARDDGSDVDGGAAPDSGGLWRRQRVKGRKIHALVYSEGLPMGSLSTPPRIKTATGRVWFSTRYAAASLGST